MAQNSSRTWKFFRAGGFDQVKLQSGSDLADLDKLQPIDVARLGAIEGVDVPGVEVQRR